MTRRSLIHLPGSPGADYSIDLDGSTETYTSSAVALGITEQWSISLWSQVETAKSCAVLALATTSNNNAIIINTTSTRAEFNIRSSTGTLFKTYLLQRCHLDLDWHNYLFTFDGTLAGDVVTMYYDGILCNPTKSTDNTGTMTNGNRRIQYGAETAFFGLGNFNGNLGHLGIWSTVLDQDDALEIFRPTQGYKPMSIDLRINQGGYDKASSLVHYYRPGFYLPGADVGTTDLGSGGVTLTGTNLTSADIVSSAPDRLSEKKSVDLNGTNEFYQAGIADGMGNSWSISQWIKTALYTTDQTIMDFDVAANANNQITIKHAGATGGDPLTIAIKNATGTLFKEYFYNGALDGSSWHNFIFTWNGTSLLMYLDKTLTTASSKPTDDTDSMTNTTRDVSRGCMNDGSVPFTGNFGHTAVWSTVLDQDDVDAIFAGKHNIALQVNSSTYDKASSLINYWRPGIGIGAFDPFHASNSNSTISSNITLADDVVLDAPA